MNEDKQPQAQPHSEKDTRRKLIKGLAGLPAVLTLGSGSAHALASNQECAADIEAGGRNPWQAGVYTNPVLNTDLEAGDGDDAYCEVWPEGVAAPPNGYTDLDTLSLKSYDPKAFRDDTNSWVLQYESTLTEGDRVCVTWFDSANEQLYYTAAGDGSDRRWPVAASCYASFVPGA